MRLLFAVSLGFFDDIVIPAEHLPTPSHFVEGDSQWVWHVPGEDDEISKLSIDNGTVLFIELCSLTLRNFNRIIFKCRGNNSLQGVF